MKKLKENQLGPWCDFCTPKTTRAVWRSSGASLIHHACDGHTEPLKQTEKANATPGEDRLTEADYQTWHRL